MTAVPSCYQCEPPVLSGSPNSCGLDDENRLSILNRQNLSKLGQCLQIIFNHFSNSIKSYILFLKRRVSKL